MPQLPARSGPPTLSPLESLRQGVRQRQVSPEGRRAWLGMRLAFLLTLLSLLGTALLPGAWRNLVGGAFAVAAAAQVFRLHWPAVGGKRFWRWALILSAVALLIPWGPLTVTGRIFGPTR